MSDRASLREDLAARAARRAALAVCGALALTGGLGESIAGAALPTCGEPAARSAQKSNGTREARRTAAKAKRAANRSTAAGPPVKATLTLDDKDPQAVAETAFGRSTDPQQLTLVYDIAGCRPPADAPAPADPLMIGPVKGSSTIPYGAVRLDGPPELDGQRYTVRLKVFTQPGPAAPASAAQGAAATETKSGDASSGAPEFTLKPGSYTGFVRVSAPWLHTAATPVTITRSEHKRWVPLLCGLVGALLGFGAFAFLRVLHKERLQVHGWVLGTAAIVSVGIGAGTAYFTNYLNQDVWSLDVNGLAAGTAAFTASTTGWAAGMLAGIWSEGKAGKTPLMKGRSRRQNLDA